MATSSSTVTVTRATWFELVTHQQLADDFDRHAFGRFHQAAAAAGGAFLVDAPLDARADALPRHFDQAERAGAEDLRAGAVAADGVAERALDVAAVALLAHVDEVVHDHAAQIAEPQLAGDFLGGDLVELVGRFLGRAIGAEVAAVDVDRDEGLGLIDHERAAAS